MLEGNHPYRNYNLVCSSDKSMEIKVLERFINHNNLRFHVHKFNRFINPAFLLNKFILHLQFSKAVLLQCVSANMLHQKLLMSPFIGNQGIRDTTRIFHGSVSVIGDSRIIRFIDNDKLWS